MINIHRPKIHFSTKTENNHNTKYVIYLSIAYQCIQYGDDVSYCAELVGIISEEKCNGEALCLKTKILERARSPSCREGTA